EGQAFLEQNPGEQRLVDGLVVDQNAVEIEQDGAQHLRGIIAPRPTFARAGRAARDRAPTRCTRPRRSDPREFRSPSAILSSGVATRVAQLKRCRPKPTRPRPPAPRPAPPPVPCS